MKFGFVTCVKIGLSCMEAIYNNGVKLDFALTLPDDIAKEKSGRVFIQSFCNHHNIPLLKSAHINNQAVIESIKKNNIDWLFIVGWSQIANSNVLNAPKRGVIGMHPTLLPEGRGRASIPWAILKDLKKTGVTMFKMDAGIDTGPIISQIKIPLKKRITATTLYDKIVEAHVYLVKKTIKPLLLDKVKLVPQKESKASIWPGRSPEDGEINLKGSVYEAEKLIRATTHPYPGAFYNDNGIKRVIWSAKVLKEMKVKPDLKKNRTLKFYDGTLVF